MRIDRFSNFVTEEHIEKDGYFSSLALTLSKPIAFLGLRERDCFKTKDSAISFKQKEPTWTCLGFEMFLGKQLNLSANVFPTEAKNEFNCLPLFKK